MLRRSCPRGITLPGSQTCCRAVLRGGVVLAGVARPCMSQRASACCGAVCSGGGSERSASRPRGDGRRLWPGP